MTHKKPTILALFLFTVLIAMGGAAVLKGGLYIAKHEGDTMHLMQIVFRMAEGQTPHFDFMTPIGALAFWPIAMFVKSGMGIGMAILWSQIVMALFLFPAVVWTAWTRLSPWTGALFGLFIMVLLLALVHGEAQGSISISMHYNRQAWAAAFVAIITAMMPPKRGQNGALDGVILGAMVCIMAMVKMTYFVSFAVPIVVALILTKQMRCFAVAALTGVLAVAVITLFNGVGYWGAYAGDLLTVAGSEVRAAPGAPLTAVMGAPAYLGGSLAAIAGVIFLRQAKIQTGGLVLLLLVPGFFFVTFQNFGNDPQWLLLLGVILLALREEAEVSGARAAINPREALGAVAVCALAFAAPSFFNLAYSPFRHFGIDTAEYVPILPRGGVHADLQGADLRVNRVDARIPMDGDITLLSRYEGREQRLEFMGEDIPVCTVESGLPRVMDVMVRDIENAGLAEGKSLFAADLFSSHWLFGALDPLEQGAPWYYGGVPGLKDADYVLVPLCPVAQAVQAQVFEILNELVEVGKLELTEIRRTELYILYQKTDLI